MYIVQYYNPYGLLGESGYTVVSVNSILPRGSGISVTYGVDGRTELDSRQFFST